jgi:hypothetical protein
MPKQLFVPSPDPLESLAAEMGVPVNFDQLPIKNILLPAGR